MIEINPLVLTK
jgi:succinyl-CoA synthetase beta subunit